MFRNKWKINNVQFIYAVRYKCSKLFTVFFASLLFTCVYHRNTNWSNDLNTATALRWCVAPDLAGMLALILRAPSHNRDDNILWNRVLSFWREIDVRTHFSECRTNIYKYITHVLLCRQMSICLDGRARSKRRGCRLAWLGNDVCRLPCVAFVVCVCVCVYMCAPAQLGSQS